MYCSCYDEFVCKNSRMFSYAISLRTSSRDNSHVPQITKQSMKFREMPHKQIFYEWSPPSTHLFKLFWWKADAWILVALQLQMSMNVYIWKELLSVRNQSEMNTEYTVPT